MKKRQFIMLLLLIAYYGSNAQKFKPLDIMVGYKGTVHLPDFSPINEGPYTLIHGLSGEVFLTKWFAFGTEYGFGKSKGTTSGIVSKFSQGAIYARALSPGLFQNRVFLSFMQSVGFQRKSIQEPMNVPFKTNGVNTTLSMGFLFRPIENLSFDLQILNLDYAYGNSLSNQSGGTIKIEYRRFAYIPLKIGANYIFSLKNNQK